MLNLLVPHSKDLGDGVIIERYLPHQTYRNVGPFIFFDYLPQIQFAAGTGTDVRPHPHIGLSTLSYLFKGRMHHRDSLGYDIILSPGDVLLMSSGKGIVHSERTPQADRAKSHQIHMVQFWLALPQSQEEMAPSVAHATQRDLPRWDIQSGLQASLAIGQVLAHQAPVNSLLNPFLVDFQTDREGHWTCPAEPRDSALFLVSGCCSFNGNSHQAPAFLMVEPNSPVAIEYQAHSRWLWLGGEPLDGPRILWWNLVASRQELIDAAKEKWRQGLFDGVTGDSEFIPLPLH